MRPATVVSIAARFTTIAESFPASTALHDTTRGGEAHFGYNLPGMDAWAGDGPQKFIRRGVHFFLVKPLQGFSVFDDVVVTRGALRDPGLRYGTALRFATPWLATP